MKKPTHGVDAHRLDATALLKGLLRIVGSGWVAASQFDGLAKDLGMSDGEQTIQFLTGVRGVLAELPEKVYATSDVRRNVLTAAQDALDAAIDREEAATEQAELAHLESIAAQPAVFDPRTAGTRMVDWFFISSQEHR